MSLGNRAATSAYYINKHFESLWQVSNECVAKHGSGIKPTKAEVEYGSCLAQLCVGKHNRAKPCKEDLKFFTSFGAPQLKFVCNHALVLELQLQSGHYKLEEGGGLEHFESYTCTFLLQYREHLITDASYPTLGQTETCKAKLLILDLSTASFLREFSWFANGQRLGSDVVDRHHKSIVNYLSTHYLPLLRKAGFHCVYSLPDFDNLSRTHRIDYSVLSEIDIEISDLFGIDVDLINTFITGRWLEGAAYVDELEDKHDHSSFGHFALAEHRGVCDDIYFHAYFSPPRIRAICSKEVILYIDVHDLHFYLGEGFHGEANHKVSNWKIAVVVEVNLVEEEEEDGCIRRIELDLSRSRFCEGRSICSYSKTMEESTFLKFRTTFIRYITQHYLLILEEFGHHNIYRIDTRAVDVEEDSNDDEEVPELRERLCITETFGFDLITTVSQGSINDHLHGLWKASQSTGGCLASWALEAFFGASFGAPQVQFPCDSSSNTVIIYFDLREGFLKNLAPTKKRIGVDRHRFSAWKLAFEVTLVLRDYTKPHPVSDNCLRAREDVGEYILKQLVLDFGGAKFRQDLSRLPGLFEGGNYRLMRFKRQALLHYITRFYFPQLKQEGHHVLYTIPTWKQAGSCGLNRYAPSSFAFQFLPAPCGKGKKSVSCLFGSQRNLGNHNMLVMCGMIDSRHRPGFPLPRCSWRWSPCQDSVSGTFALSRSIFLDGWLLRELMHTNGRTTFVPVFHGVGDDGDFDFKLVAWEKHSCNKNRLCDWKQVADCEEGLQYEWKNMNEWTYVHRGDARDIHNGGYSVSCDTSNSLIVPTVSRHGACVIKIDGKIDLRLAFTGGAKNWSTCATARWSATISLSRGTHGSGLKITTSCTNEISDFSGFVGDFEIVHPKFQDAATLLKKQLAEVLIIEQSILSELESAFSGVWPLFYSGAYGYTLCNPIFNLRGDLLFDLLSPLDRRGRSIVSGDTRRDICLPSEKLSRDQKYGSTLCGHACATQLSVTFD